MHGAAIHEQVRRLVRSQPFTPFVLYLENGMQVSIDHPEKML